MTNFHPHTIDELRNELDGWRERLDNAEVDLRFREGQAAKAREVAEAARQRVADYERLLAVVEPAKDEPDADSGLCATHGHPLDERGMCPVAIDLAPVRTDGTYTDAQLSGNACGKCGREFGRYEDMRPFMTATRGELMQHSDPDDCKAVDR